jgi:hypothetical protein
MDEIRSASGKRARHLEAAELHDAAARRHDEAVVRWSAEGEAELVALELRNAAIERLAAGLERDRAAFFAARGETAPPLV